MRKKGIPHATVVVEDVEFENWGSSSVQVTPANLPATNIQTYKYCMYLSRPIS